MTAPPRSLSSWHIGVTTAGAEVEELAPYFSALEVPAGVELYSVATATQSTRPNYPPSDWLLEAGWQ